MTKNVMIGIKDPAEKIKEYTIYTKLMEPIYELWGSLVMTTCLFDGAAGPSLSVTSNIPKIINPEPANQLTGTFSLKMSCPKTPLVKKFTAEDMTTTMTVLFCSIAFKK